MHRDSAELKRFLRASLYRHPQVVATTERAQEVIRVLFEAYAADPSAAPVSAAGTRKVADYIAGMTDRFALREHERITGRPAFD
jgi:dGTPase